MFRAQIIQLANGPTLKMEGNLVGQWAEEARSLLTSGPVPHGLVIDLTDVSYVDSVGEDVLAWFASVGASFMAKAVYAASLCERLQLPVHRKPPVSTIKNTVVLASAGTGKTRKLVDVYLELLERGMDPLRIVAVTFTEKAAAGLVAVRQNN